MSLINGVWSDLKFMAGDAAGSMLTNLAYRVHKNKNAGDVQYIYQRAYKNVLVFAAKRYLVQKAERELKAILPTMQRKFEKQMIDTVRAQQESRYAKLISTRTMQMQDYNQLKTKEGNIIKAKDKYGSPVIGSLILSYDGDDTVTVNDVDTGVDGEQVMKTFTTVTRYHIDLSPEISMSSNKNIVLTQVTGRDYTRKELVSGGDFQFQVNGSIVSDKPGVYPEDKVKAFLQIMQYNGIINVNSHFFGNMNVKQILIRDFNLDKQEYMNVQPYSFSCVAVEPDEEIKLVKDTIQELNSELILSPVNKWYQLVLKNKLAQIVTNAAINTVTNAATTAAVNAGSMGLDALTGWNNTNKDA